MRAQKWGRRFLYVEWKRDSAVKASTKKMLQKKSNTHSEHPHTRTTVIEIENENYKEIPKKENHKKKKN